MFFRIIVLKVWIVFFMVEVKAQDPVKLYIKYDYEHISDTNKRDVPVKGSQYLYISEKASYLTHLTHAKPEIDAQQTAMGVSIMRNPSTDLVISYFNPFGTKDQPFLLDMIGRPYRITEPVQKIQWDIQQETREIGGYACTKAIGTFAGRTYTAWFTPEIPYPVGPWKLNGLPGAILEAFDQKDEVKFFYAGLDKPDKTIEMLEVETIAELSYEKYLKAIENQQHNDFGGMLSNLPAGAKVIIKDQTGREITRDELEAKLKEQNKAQKFEMNNPADKRNLHPSKR
jgi:GLPGLI family protein